MADDDQLPWDADTDLFVSDISAGTVKGYEVDFRTLLLNPLDYKDKKDISGDLKNIRVDVESYFQDLRSQLTDEDKELTAQLEALDAMYTQVNQTVTSRASIARIPFIKPSSVDLSSAAVEIMSVEQYSSQLDLLITKLIGVSNYVVDITTTYKKYNMGAWLFSGPKSTLIMAKVPDNPIMTLENGQDVIEALLDNAESTLEAAGNEAGAGTDEGKKPEATKK